MVGGQTPEAMRKGHIVWRCFARFPRLCSHFHQRLPGMGQQLPCPTMWRKALETAPARDCGKLRVTRGKRQDRVLGGAAGGSRLRHSPLRRTGRGWALFVINHVDAVLAQPRQHVLDEPGRHLPFRHGRVDLIYRDVAALPTAGDQVLQRRTRASSNPLTAAMSSAGPAPVELRPSVATMRAASPAVGSSGFSQRTCRACGDHRPENR